MLHFLYLNLLLASSENSRSQVVFRTFFFFFFSGWSLRYDTFKKFKITWNYYPWWCNTMTNVDSFYWGCYYIRSLIESFKTYRPNWCLSFSNLFWGLSYFYLDRVQLKFKANQDREKIKGSILYNKLFQSDLISSNVSFHSSFLSSHVWIITHQSRNQNISLPLSHSVSLQWPA